MTKFGNHLMVLPVNFAKFITVMVLSCQVRFKFKMCEVVLIKVNLPNGFPSLIHQLYIYNTSH
jgi:hypothetical protein